MFPNVNRRSSAATKIAEGHAIMAAAKKSTARERALILLALVGLTFYYACTELAQTHWRTGFGALLLTFGFVVWLVMTQVRSHCGVLNADGKRYCRNPIKGLFFGCHLHTWQRPLSFIKLGARPEGAPRVSKPSPNPLPHAAVPSAPIPTSSADERERRRMGILFYVTIGSLVTGSLSTFTDLFGFFKQIT
jgi:hypothetical protein